MFNRLRDDIASVFERDPAARTTWEVLTCYPGVHALYIHKVARWFWRHGLRWLGRMTSHFGRLLTGIEIHPGAKIGRRLFIDHGMGVVIGETAEIGDDVTLYQGVTLGGTKLNRGKRHPTLEDGVIVGAGAKVLGGFTVGKNARIGSNALVIAAVPPGARVFARPSKPLMREGATKEEFLPYGTPGDDIPDPVARALNGLVEEVGRLRARVEELERELAKERSEPALKKVSG